MNERKRTRREPPPSEPAAPDEAWLPPATDLASPALRRLLDHAVVGVSIVQDGRYAYVNDAYARIWGHDRASFRDAEPLEAAAPELHAQRDGSAKVVARRRSAEGDWRSAEFTSWHIMLDDRPAVVSVCADATDRIERERDLSESRAWLRMAEARTSRALEKQSSQIARDLHDSIGACLVSMKMNVARMARRQLAPDMKGIADDLAELIGQANAEMRRIAGQLQPSVLDGTALVDALARDVDQFAKRTGLRCRFVARQPDIAVPEDAVIGIYRIFQESLSNIARHASAKSVTVRVAQDKAGLLLEVIDDGRGLDRGADTAGGLGIRGMHERAKGMGATLAIGANRGVGTRLQLRVPYAQPPTTRGSD